ncbi:MAG: DUF1501 domain-containing protein [Verrucomicrobiales bacterium]|nr:DUF1501 domain-containing protein [Verrucomicrobiales bacterium]
MSPFDQLLTRTRRDFLATSSCGLGTLALASLFQQDGLLAQESALPADPLATRKPHFAPKAERCIFIFLEGGPSQMDLFDPKPMLNKHDGQPLPDSLVGDQKFAFLQKDTATVMGTKRVFKKHGQCGMEMSDLLPHLSTCVDDIALIRSMHTTQFNHLPGQLMLNCGAPLLGRPSVGSWLTYGLGNTTQDLPSYVVMVSKGRGLPGGSSTWSSGFLPSSYSGVMFRNGASPVLNLENPAGISADMQAASLTALNDLNRLQHKHIGDPEITSRINSYELAFRMQSAAPELVDLSGESQATLDAYGINRVEPPIKSNLGGIGNFQIFSRHCLQARRMIERGVRFVNIIHASWDHHSNLDSQLAHNCLMVDQPITALLKDLKQRGLLDTTLVVWGSEFGRTALGENRPGNKSITGRDHHPGAFSLWMAGGGVKGGLTYGETDDFAWHVARDPVSVHDFHATILHLFGFDHKRLTYRFQGRDFRLTDVHGNLVPGLLA